MALQEGHGKTNETINCCFFFFFPAALQRNGVIMGGWAVAVRGFFWKGNKELGRQGLDWRGRGG